MVSDSADTHERKVGIRTEAVAGLTTFFTMAYIVVVNPLILSTEGTGMPYGGVLTATVLVCFTMTLLMGLYARLPFAVAPGMGINAFFAYTIILTERVPWQVALGIVFWAGVLFLVVSVTPLRESIARAILKNLRTATAAGIGVFLTFIGLQNAGLVAAHPATLVRLGDLDHRALLMLLGLAVIALLMKRAARSPTSRASSPSRSSRGRSEGFKRRSSFSARPTSAFFSSSTSSARSSSRYSRPSSPSCSRICSTRSRPSSASRRPPGCSTRTDTRGGCAKA